ncbi:hypothetical protein [Methylobacter sp.]|jgi:hypothetical protein|uniref:hypothetical protein n=1 Tax=Methylobacter sp. TaxID=2051955 RepID=UPI003DA52571
MNKKIILGSTIAALALSPLTSSAAGDDEQYPAANFQPKVVYIDKEAVKLEKEAAKKECDEKPSAKPERKKAEFDPKYPAANFQPKVIFPAAE